MTRTGVPKVHIRRPIPRRKPSQMWEHTAVIGFCVAALLVVIAVAQHG